MTLLELQARIATHYAAGKYAESPQTLLIGALEELGEVARDVLMSQCADYVASARKQQEYAHMDVNVHIAREIGDVLVYLLALCNALHITPMFDEELFDD